MSLLTCAVVVCSIPVILFCATKHWVRLVVTEILPGIARVLTSVTVPLETALDKVTRATSTGSVDYRDQWRRESSHDSAALLIAPIIYEGSTYQILLGCLTMVWML